MADHPYVEDLIATVQKRPLLRILRDMRNDATTREEASALHQLIKAISRGDLDG